MAKITARHYESNLDHLLAELSLLDLRLSREIQRVRHHYGELGEEFRGLLVSEEQIDSISSAWPVTNGDHNSDPDPLLPIIQQRERDLADTCLESREKGVSLRLERLRELYNFDPWDTGVMILCLAPELDLKYEALYSYLQDDVGKKQPTVNLALNLLCDGLADRVAKRKYFLHFSPLTKHELVHIAEEPYGKGSPFLAWSLRLDPPVLEYLLGSEALDSRLQHLAKLTWPETSWDEVVLPAQTKSRLEALVGELKEHSEDRKGIVLQLVGPEGTGKKTVAQALSHSLGRPLLVIDGEAVQSSELPLARLVNHTFREALLHDAVLCWDNFHLLLGDEPQQRAAQALLGQALGEHPGLTILVGHAPWRPQRGLEEQILLTVELPLPEYSDRKNLWKNQLNDHQGQLNDEEFALLASKFRFSGGQVRRVVTTARGLALWRSWGDGEITAEDLHSASRWHSGQKLALLAQKIEPRYSWEDIVLPPDQKAQLKEICGYFNYQPLVYEQWGFQSKTSLGKGLNILFAGPSGTGKTMAAEIMADELGLDLYKIDLSSVVSKYIGETEKNLDRIFHEAEDSNAILFFDEADALFGKRSEVRDAHDRYANIEISYLLQKMEEYHGISILTTNLRKNIDDAFARRLHFAVEFPFPEEEYRHQIWQRAFPPAAPQDQTVVLSFLARQLKISGGNIKNIAVTAAFLAAQESKSIGMEHLMRATKREYQKMGRLLVEADFGPYFELIKG